jgi:hypothetical protein
MAARRDLSGRQPSLQPAPGASSRCSQARANDSGKPISGIAVDVTARTLTFSGKVLNGSSGETVTLSGTASFPKNAGTPACGA